MGYDRAMRALFIPLIALACTGGDSPNETPCGISDLTAPDADFFSDISETSGMQVDNYSEDPPAGTSINDHSRLAVSDINGDGFDDLVMHSLFPNAQNGVPFEHLVFLNSGDGSFADFSDDSGLRDIQAAFFAFGDVDNDGDQDVFAGVDVPDLGAHHQILLNDGSGHFSPLADSGVDDLTYAMAANAAFADFDGDGILDLFIGQGSTMYAMEDYVFLGQGDGRFDKQRTALATAHDQPSNGSITCDMDGDGDPDILVSTYGVSVANGVNHWWDNDGDADFVNVAVERGFASLATGNYWTESTGYGAEPEPDADAESYMGSNGFGIDCGDVDNDGDLDVFLTALSHPSSTDQSRKWSDPSQLLINTGAEGGWTLENQWLERGLPFNEGDVDGAMVDFDNDGRLDLSLSRDTKYENSYDEVDQKSWFGLMHQQDDGSFESLGFVSGINDPDEDLDRMKGAQNHAWTDIDRDGDLDLLVGGRDQGGGRPNFLFRNEIGQDNGWLAVELEGDGEQVNRDAIGARVTLRWDDELLMKEKKSSRGMYNSEDTRVLHFGLGTRDCDYTVEIRWPDGSTQELSSDEVPPGSFTRITYP
jgi:hypothetical protein